MSDPLLRLHGYPVSNYFNIARAAMLEKNLEFEVVVVRASQSEAFLSMNPMGKIPALETSDGWVGETVAILEYLDDRYPGISLRPNSLADRARARQIVNIVQVYVEMPVRTLFPGVFNDGENASATTDAARATLDRATVALARLMVPTPFLFGSRLSAADLFAFYNLDIADRVTRFVYDRSIIAEIGIVDWHAMIAKRTSSHVVLAEFERYFAQYLQDRGAHYRADATSGHLKHA